MANAILLDAKDNVATCTADNIDVDLSGIIAGDLTIADAGELLLKNIHDVCNGRLTKAEAYSFSDVAVDRVCRFV